MAGRIAPRDALAEACAQAGLDACGASVLYDRSNTVYMLAGRPAVVRLRYAPGSGAWRDRLAISVQVTGWLHEQGFPAVRPLDIARPVEAHGYLVTFWPYLPASGPPWEDVESLGRLLRRLHGLGPPTFLAARGCRTVRLAHRGAAILGPGPCRGADPPVRRNDLDAGLRDDPRRRLDR
jgi:Phosphotransferase enzyme family